MNDIMIFLFGFWTALTVSATELRIHFQPPETNVSCELKLTDVTEELKWQKNPSHWITFTPVAGQSVPQDWDVSESALRKVADNYWGIAFTINPNQFQSFRQGWLGETLSAMTGQAQLESTADLALAKKTFESFDPELQDLIVASHYLLQSGKNGRMFRVQWTLMLQNGRKESVPALILVPDRTSKRGLLVIDHLSALYLGDGFSDDYFRMPIVERIMNKNTFLPVTLQE